VDYDHPSTTSRRRRKSRFDDEDDDPRLLNARHRHLTAPSPNGPACPDDAPTRPRTDAAEFDGWAAAADGPGEPDFDDGWTSWLDAVHGPTPRPGWVVTELAARDTELGVLKTGKEADVHLVRREVPDTERSCLMAAKRYRDPQHRLFHRDATYIEGRRVRRSRETRAMARRTEFGRDLLAGQWAAAEFDALSRLWQLGQAGGITVPYPVQVRGTELMLEFIGEPDGAAAPRLAQLRPDPDTLTGYWLQLVDALGTLARVGLAHGDLSPYNILVHRGQLILIDLPQVVDIVANPLGPRFLARDVRVVSDWFAARGLDTTQLDAAGLLESLITDAGLPPDAAPPLP
jgi:RIO kinase 1